MATIMYAFRWDIVYAATVYPAWVYACGGLLIGAAGRPKPFLRFFRWPLVLWIAFTLAFAEESRSLLRLGAWPSAAWKEARRHGRAIRIVSLNCAGGSAEAAEEVGNLKPDIVLLQESPPRKAMKDLAERILGPDASCVPGPDASILVRGKARAIPLPRGAGDFVAAVIELASGQECLVVSLRLVPPVLRFDYWNPECWQDYALNLRMRREQLRAIVGFVERHRSSRPLIVGGDFNVGPYTSVARALPADLRDSFREAGRGWPHTAINDFALVRIDQIWVSDSLRIDSALVRKTVHSDHRMAVCDVIADQGGNMR